MAKMAKCKTCGADIAKSAKVCPNCGAKNKKPPIALIIIGMIVVIGIIGSAAGGGNSSREGSYSNAVSSTSTPKPTATPEPEKNIRDFNFDTSGYQPLSANILYEYGKYITGEKVLTQLGVSSISRSYFQSHTANEESYTYAFQCDFDSNSVNKQLEKASNITVAGIISDKSTEKTIKLKDCVVVSDSSFTPEEENAQMEYCVAFKIAYEEAVDAQLKAERDEYAADCVTVSYDDVARNPDNYKGKKITIIGKVIQVSEGLLNSVTLRLNENGGSNTWYITYTHKDGESRILENDWITCYGECDGVTTYTTVLGSSVTIPALKMKYFN